MVMERRRAPSDSNQRLQNTKSKDTHDLAYGGASTLSGQPAHCCALFLDTHTFTLSSTRTHCHPWCGTWVTTDDHETSQQLHAGGNVHACVPQLISTVVFFVWEPSQAFTPSLSPFSLSTASIRCRHVAKPCCHQHATGMYKTL